MIHRYVICEVWLLQDVDVECVAILNDTVGCLMSCAFLDHHAQIGVILGDFAHSAMLESPEFIVVVNSDKLFSNKNRVANNFVVLRSGRQLCSLSILCFGFVLIIKAGRLNEVVCMLTRSKHCVITNG